MTLAHSENCLMEPGVLMGPGRHSLRTADPQAILSAACGAGSPNRLHVGCPYLHAILGRRCFFTGPS